MSADNFPNLSAGKKLYQIEGVNSDIINGLSPTKEGIMGQHLVGFINQAVHSIIIRQPGVLQHVPYQAGGHMFSPATVVDRF